MKDLLINYIHGLGKTVAARSLLHMVVHMKKWGNPNLTNLEDSEITRESTVGFLERYIDQNM